MFLKKFYLYTALSVLSTFATLTLSYASDSEHDISEHSSEKKVNSAYAYENAHNFMWNCFKTKASHFFEYLVTGQVADLVEKYSFTKVIFRDDIFIAGA
jgi:hypothetical protein